VEERKRGRIMDTEMTDVYKKFGDNIDELLDSYQSGKIDESTFPVEVFLARLKTKVPPYDEILQIRNIKLCSTIELISGLLCGKQLCVVLFRTT
jgi:hypothetical protein